MKQAPRHALVASLLLVLAYVVSGVVDSSAARDFQQAPFVDLATAHAKGKRPARLQLSEPQSKAGNTTVHPTFQSHGTIPATVHAGLEWWSTSCRFTFALAQDEPPPLPLRTRHPRDPPRSSI